MTHRIDIVIPVYNEKENFQTVLSHIRTYVRSDWRLLLVYDFPEDTTLDIATPAAREDPRIRLIRNDSRGALNAIKTGFAAADADAVLLLMVDDPASIVSRIDALTDAFYGRGAAVAVASRYMPGGSHSGGPLLKGFLSRMAGLSLHYVIGLPTHDATYATRMYRRTFLHATTIEAQKGFELTLGLTLKAYFAGLTIVEIPVDWEERVLGESRFPLLKWLPAYLKWYVWGIKMRYNPFERKKSVNA